MRRLLRGSRRRSSGQRRSPPRARRALGLLLGFVAVLAGAPAALATCVPIAGVSPGIVPARFEPVALPEAGEVRLTFLGHSSFLLETPGGATAVTDYNGYIRPAQTPHVVTMNNAHSTHYTDVVEPGVEHVLRGWDPAGGIAVHDIRIEDLRVRNVPTNVRDFGGTRYNGNSIFVFEVADLCIAHLGHLHHVLSDEHLGKLGVIDVLLVPVDGGFTASHEVMVQVVEQINAPLVIPMHFFGSHTLDRFIEQVAPRYEPVYSEQPAVTVSRLNLPYGKLLVLPNA